MNRPDEYAGFFAMQAYWRDSEDAEAARLLAYQPTVTYCAGNGAPVVECRTMDEWRAARVPPRTKDANCAVALACGHGQANDSLRQN